MLTNGQISLYPFIDFTKKKIAKIFSCMEIFRKMGKYLFFYFIPQFFKKYTIPNFRFREINKKYVKSHYHFVRRRKYNISLTLSLWITLDESANLIQPLRGPLEQSSVSTTLIRSAFLDLSPPDSS